MSELALVSEQNDFDFSPIPGLASQPAVQAGVGGFSFRCNRSDIPKSCGVYRIVFDCGKFYYGSTRAKGGFRSRFNDHVCHLESNYHANSWMQNLFNKYGIDSARFEIVEITDKEQARNKEQFYLDKFFTHADCVNMSDSAHFNRLGRMRANAIESRKEKRTNADAYFRITWGVHFNNRETASCRLNEMYDGGMSVREIAIRFGVGSGTVRRLLIHRTSFLSSGAILKRKRMMSLGENFSSIVRFFAESGMSKTWTQKILKTSPSILDSACDAGKFTFSDSINGKMSAKTRLNQNANNHKERIGIVKMVSESGGSLNDISKILGIGISGVSQYLKRHNIKRQHASVKRTKLIDFWGSIENYNRIVSRVSQSVADGFNVVESAKILGLAKSNVYSICKREHISVPKNYAKTGVKISQTKTRLHKMKAG